MAGIPQDGEGRIWCVRTTPLFRFILFRAAIFGFMKFQAFLFHQSGDFCEHALDTALSKRFAFF